MKCESVMGEYVELVELHKDELRPIKKLPMAQIFCYNVGISTIIMNSAKEGSEIWSRWKAWVCHHLPGSAGGSLKELQFILKNFSSGLLESDKITVMCRCVKPRLFGKVAMKE